MVFLIERRCIYCEVGKEEGGIWARLQKKKIAKRDY